MSKSQPTLLIKNARQLVTMNQRREIIRNGSILIEGNKIIEINSKLKNADIVLDATGKIILPGFINTHHHFFQAFLRHVPAMQNQRIDKWIAILSNFAKKMSPEARYQAAMVNMVELLFSGCTTAADMSYIFPQKFNHLDLFASEVKAANDIGIRFHPFRGSLSLSKKDGSEFDDDVVENSDQIIERTRQIIDKFHQSGRDAMLKVGIGPCTIFTNTPKDYRQAAILAKEFDLNLQTHLSESNFEQQLVQEKYHKTPLELFQSLGWDDERANFVHCLELENQDIDLLKKHHSSVCHCPISNARSSLGQQGVAPIWEMLEKGLTISIGVDGSAGNDSSNILEEMRWARTMQGVRPQSTYLKPEDVLYMGTMGGARALRWDDMLGSLEVGKCADLAIFDIRDSISHVGVWDEIGSLISCQAKRADTVIINGKIVIDQGQLQTLNETKVIKKARHIWKTTFEQQ